MVVRFVAYGGTFLMSAVLVKVEIKVATKMMERRK
jgi:hypothetical protein